MAIMNSDWFASTPTFSSVWPELVSGRVQVKSCGATQACHFLQLAPQFSHPGPNELPARQVRILERVLLGERPKVVAIEEGCSQSTVACAVGECLRAMGIRTTGSRVPALLVLALHAVRGKAPYSGVQVDRVPGDGPDLELRSDRLELPLSDGLTASELAVVGLVVEGYSHAEIAARRRTSVRTVANQIASVYKKLKVSGRIELLCHLISRIGTGARDPGRGSPGQAAHAN